MDLNAEPITPQVYNTLFTRAIRERLDGHIFSNTAGARAACVYVRAYPQGFYASGDEGMRMGVANFPFDWKAFDKLTGEQVTTGLGDRKGYGFANTLRSLYTSAILNSNRDTTAQLFINKIKQNLPNEPLSFIQRLSSQLREKNYDQAEFLSEEALEEIVKGEVLIELYKIFISEAVYNKINENFSELMREEIKEYLKKNPEAIQLRKIARRNLSRN